MGARWWVALAALAALSRPSAAQQWSPSTSYVSVSVAPSGIPGSFNVTATCALANLPAWMPVPSWIAAGFGPKQSSQQMANVQVVMGCAGCSESSNGILRYYYTSTASTPPLSNTNDYSNAVFSKNKTMLSLRFTASQLGSQSIAAATRVVAAIGQLNSAGIPRTHDARGYSSPVAVDSSTVSPTTGAPSTGTPTRQPSSPTGATAPTTGAPATPTPAPVTDRPTSSPTQEPTTGTPTLQPSTGSPTQAGQSSVTVLGGLGTLSWVPVAAGGGGRLLAAGAAAAPAAVSVTLDVATTGWVSFSIGGPTMIGSHAVVGAGSAEGVSPAPGVFACVLTSQTTGCTAAYGGALLPAGNASFSRANGRSRLVFVGSSVAGRAFSASDTVSVAYGNNPAYSRHEAYTTLDLVWAGNATVLAADPNGGYIAHGVLMALSFLYLFPAGSVAPVLLRDRMEPGQWLHVHRWVQLLGTAATVAAFVTILVVSTAGAFVSTHAKLGLALFVAAMLQPLLASFSALRTHPRARAPWRQSHFVLAYFIFAAGVAECVLGVQQARIYIASTTAVDAIAVFTYVGYGLLALCVLAVSWNRFQKWGDDPAKRARERIKAANEAKAKAQREQDAQDGASKTAAKDESVEQPPVMTESSLVKQREGQSHSEGITVI
jgi:hypothetical protein